MRGFQKHLYSVMKTDHLFKAKKVRFRDISHFWGDFSLFQPKTTFCPKFSFWAPFPPILAPKPVFPLLGLQKTSQNVTFIRGFEQGAPGPPFEPKNAFLGPKMRKRAKFRFLGPKSVKSDAETIGFISICGQGAKMTPKCISGPQNAFWGPKCEFGPKMRFWAPKCAPGKGVQGGNSLFRTAVVKSDVSKMLFL